MHPSDGTPSPPQGPAPAQHGSPYPQHGSPYPPQATPYPQHVDYPQGPNGSAPGPAAFGPPLPPSGSQVPSAFVSALRKGATWRTALIPPGLALLAGLIVSIIISVLLTSLAEFDSFAADTGISLDGLSYALPFIFLALSLFGSAVFRFDLASSGIVEANGSVVLLGAPLLVTVVVIGVLWWSTKRSELRAPAPNRASTWTRIAITGLAATLVLFLLQLIFAARFSALDGEQLIELEFSAVTARSFFLPLLAIVVTSVVGRAAGHFKGTEALGAPFLRRAVPPLLVTAVHLVVSVGLLSIVALFVIPLGLDLPWQLIPLAVVNVGLILSLLVHFGGVSATGQGDLGFASDSFSQSLTIFSSDAPGQLWIGVLVAVLAVLVAVSVSTVTRRPYWTVRGEDRQQWSSVWQVPVAFCVIWGLVSVLAVPLRASMEGSAEAAMLLGGSGAARFGIGPLAWSFLILALWGALIEILSRTIGARLVLTVPAIAKFAAGRAIHPYWGQTLGMSEPRFALIHADALAEATAVAPPPPPTAAPTDGSTAPHAGAAPVAGYAAQPGAAAHSGITGAAEHPLTAGGRPEFPGATPYVQQHSASVAAATAPPPAKPFDKRKATIVGVAAGSIAVLIVAALIVVNQVNARAFSPEAAVEKYFSELADGDAEGALEMADVDVAAEQRQLLTNDVLSASKALPQNVSVEDAEISGDVATVSATYDIGGSKGTSTFTLHKAGRTAVVFDEWKLQAPELAHLSVETPGLSTVKVNGVPVDTDGSALSLPAFPGLYTVGLAEESELVTADAVETRTFFADSADVEGTETPPLSAQPTDAFRAEVDKQVKTLIDSCADKTVAQPDGCPFGSSLAESYEAENIKWSISSYPTITVADSSSADMYFDSGSPTGPNGGPAWSITSETSGEAFITGDYEMFGDERETFDDTVTFSIDGTAEVVDGKVVVSIAADPYGF
ncbi:hypothetical protein DFO66_102244 [Brevibacterium sanguinis]|uniref:Uncharacterized protein n=2 Tax=Brevibacterium TaxID=1696 RepID=A0A366ILV4_9MICO|nr:MULTISPECIES: hypothetical protein [Brevibacterium]RBP67191.1 hypothetical protein DFO66_102244 [Brevibacterium sanguinis]RBP73716.1 hypothetical protein DFO65_102244 [Brevibacterium celere]